MKVSLKEYFEVQLKAIKKAVKVAKDEMIQKFALLNEIRGTLVDQAETFARKKDVDDLEKEVKLLREWKSNVQGKTSVAIIIAIISALLALISLIVLILNS